MDILRFYIKLILTLLLVITFLLLTSVVNLIIRNNKLKLSFLTKITTFLCDILLPVLGVRVKTEKSKSRFSQGENYLVVSNHLSYLDTFIIASKINSVFVASVDGHQQKFPVGMITKNSGGIFVERKNKRSALRDMEKINRTLLAGFNIVLFPESTTSDGRGILPFRTPFFSPSFKEGVIILPVCINYKKINNSDITKENKNLVFFYEEIGFINHFLRMLRQKNIDVELKFNSPVNPLDFSSRKEVAKHVYKKILADYEPKP